MKVILPLKILILSLQLTYSMNHITNNAFINKLSKNIYIIPGSLRTSNNLSLTQTDRLENLETHLGIYKNLKFIKKKKNK